MSHGGMMGDASKFWEIMATVIPVIALAFVVEVRYLRLDEMGPFRRLFTAITHAATILILLFSELAALGSLAGRPQADWARDVALNGCAIALAVVLSAPASRFLLVAAYGTHPTTYAGYWKVKRLLREHRRELKKTYRVLRSSDRQQERVQRMIKPLAEKANTLPAHDLHTVWAKELNADLLESAVALRDEIAEHREQLVRQIGAAHKRERKMERRIVKMAGRRTKSLLRHLDKAQA